MKGKFHKSLGRRVFRGKSGEKNEEDILILLKFFILKSVMNFLCRTKILGRQNWTKPLKQENSASNESHHLVMSLIKSLNQHQV